MLCLRKFKVERMKFNFFNKKLNLRIFKYFSFHFIIACAEKSTKDTKLFNTKEANNLNFEFFPSAHFFDSKPFKIISETTFLTSFDHKNCCQDVNVSTCKSFATLLLKKYFRNYSYSYIVLASCS